MQATRPAPITAAGVLLIVVGADTILAGGCIAALTIGFPMSTFVEVWLLASGLFLVTAFVGGLFIRTGRRLLAGCILAPSFTGTTLLVIGIVLTVVGGMLALAALWMIAVFNPPAAHIAEILGIVLGILFHAIAVLYSGAAIGDKQEEYAAWQRTLSNSPPTPDDQ